MYAGQRSGIPITRDQALRWITVNPAWPWARLDRGTLEPGENGRRGGVVRRSVLVYSKAVQVYNDAGWRSTAPIPHASRAPTSELGEVPLARE